MPRVRRKMHRGGGGGVVPPGGVGNGVVWWTDFSDVTTLYQTDDTSTPVTADGQTIGLAKNKVSLNQNMTATGATRPIYKTGIKNGRSIARGTGAQRLTTTTMPLGTSVAGKDHTCFAVVMATAMGGDQMACGMRNSVDPDPIKLQMGFNVDAATLDYRLDDGGGLARTNVGLSVGGTFYILTGTEASLVQKMWRSGGAPGISGTLLTSPGVTVDLWTIMDVGTGGAAVNGDMCELLLYNRALSLAEINAVGAALGTKWGITWTTATAS